MKGVVKSPQELLLDNPEPIPKIVHEAFEELIQKKYSGTGSGVTVDEKEIREAIQGKMDNPSGFRRRWLLGALEAFRANGWTAIRGWHPSGDQYYFSWEDNPTEMEPEPKKTKTLMEYYQLRHQEEKDKELRGQLFSI